MHTYEAVMPLCQEQDAPTVLRQIFDLEERGCSVRTSPHRTVALAPSWRSFPCHRSAPPPNTPTAVVINSEFSAPLQ